MNRQSLLANTLSLVCPLVIVARRFIVRRPGTCTLCVLLMLCSVLTADTPAWARPTGFDNHQVVKIHIADQTQLAVLRALDAASDDFEIWSEGLGVGVIEARVSPDQKRKLDASGLKYTVHIEDLQVHIDEMYADRAGGGFFDQYRTYDEHVTFLNDLVAQYPTLAQTVDLGLSVEGRTLLAIRITGPGASKVGVIYHGAQHGNEQAGAMLVAYTANHLLTNYATDPEVQTLVDNAEWYLLPIMNPDGYEAYSRYNAHGVDLNRNWGGPGSGDDPSGGPYPFSEPETAALRDFFPAYPNVRLHLDVHGYVPWFMWPWGHKPGYSPDHSVYHSVGIEVRDLIDAAGGAYYEIGSIREVAYPVSGGSADYSYGDLNLWGYAFELTHSTIPDIYDQFLSTLLFLASWVSDCNDNGIPDFEETVGGSAPDCNDNGVPDECDINHGTSFDCNLNDVPDECDIAAGTSLDENDNGCPDECALLFVKPGATGAETGTSWADAFPNLPDALVPARHAGGCVTEIWVARGVHTPGEPGDQTATFSLPGGVAIYGGFAGTETTRAQRDPQANVTALSGDLAGDDGPNFANNEENAYHVVTALGTGESTILDGLHIIGGHAADPGPVYGEYGGGLYLEDGELTVRNCVFTANEAVGPGGALSAREATLTLVDCALIGNTSSHGGACYTYETDATIAGSLFSGNTAGFGGALDARTEPTLINSTFSYNTAANYGGGIRSTGLGVATLTNCVLWGNSDLGGSDESAQIDADSPTVNYCCIQGLTGGFGGTGNIGLDPQFVDADGADDVIGTADDDAHLSPGSPSIDTGDPGFVPVFSSTDLDGHARVLCNRVDRGAYESGIGDYTCDDALDLADYASWPACMTGPNAPGYPPGCESFDFNGDEDIDLDDFAEWLALGW